MNFIDHVIPLGAVLLSFGALASPDCPDLLDITLKRLRSSETVNLCEVYRGKTILAVNTASQCGYTPQFKGLEQLYQKYKDRGFVVLGFPSNDFKQEFSDAEETAKVCYLNYGVTFPMFEATSVRGKDANPFFRRLAEQSGQEPGWNFYKYLIGPDGRVVEAFGSQITPEDPGLRERIEKIIAGGRPR